MKGGKTVKRTKIKEKLVVVQNAKAQYSTDLD